MKRRTLYLGAVLVAGALVWLAGWALARDGVRGVSAGVGVGMAFQLLLFALLVTAFPGRPLIAYGVGMVGRMVLVVAAALVVVPVSGLPAAPFLFSLVTVLFTTTLLEPVLMAPGPENDAR